LIKIPIVINFVTNQNDLLSKGREFKDSCNTCIGDNSDPSNRKRRKKATERAACMNVQYIQIHLIEKEEKSHKMCSMHERSIYFVVFLFQFSHSYLAKHEK
jgi:hypothetical protein